MVDVGQCCNVEKRAMRPYWSPGVSVNSEWVDCIVEAEAARAVLPIATEFMRDLRRFSLVSQKETK